MNITKQQVKHMVDTMTPAEIKTLVQDQARHAWGLQDKRGTIEAATGVGKTRIALLAVWAEVTANPEALVYIITPTETLRDTDWPAEMVKHGFAPLVDNPNVRRLCYSSLGREVPERDVDLIILDEIHHMTPNNYQFFTNSNWKVFAIMGLTATLPDGKYPDDQDKLLIINSIAPSVFQVTLEEAVELKLVSEFEVIVMKFDLDDTKNTVLSGSGKQQHMTTELKHYKWLTKQLQKSMFNPKFAGAKFIWIQKRAAFIRNCESKYLMAKKVMGLILKDGKTLIFCGSIDQSVRLCGENVYNSETNDAMLVAFCADEIPYLGVVDALNEGKNVANLDQGLVVQGTAKSLKIIQRIGRHIRYRADFKARIVVLVAKGTVDEKWYTSAFQNFDKSRITEYYVDTET